MKKALSITVAVIAVTLSVGSIAGASTKAYKYAQWRTRYAPVVIDTYKAMRNLATDASNGNVNAVQSDFNRLNSDASKLVSGANSPDPTLNTDFRALGLATSLVVYTGEKFLNGNGPISSFSSAIKAVEVESTVVTNRLNYDNKRWLGV